MLLEYRLTEYINNAKLNIGHVTRSIYNINTIDTEQNV